MRYDILHIESLNGNAMQMYVHTKKYHLTHTHTRTQKELVVNAVHTFKYWYVSAERALMFHQMPSHWIALQSSKSSSKFICRPSVPRNTLAIIVQLTIVSIYMWYSGKLLKLARERVCVCLCLCLILIWMYIVYKSTQCMLMHLNSHNTFVFASNALSVVMLLCQ